MKLFQCVSFRPRFEPWTSRTLVKCCTLEPAGRRLGMVLSSRRVSWNTFPKNPRSQAFSLLCYGRESVRTIFVLAVSLFLSNPWGRTQRRTQHKKAVGSEQVAQASEDERNVFPRASSYSRSLVLRSSARSPATRDWSQSKNDLALKRTQKGNVVVLKRYTNYPKSNYFIAIDAFRQ